MLEPGGQAKAGQQAKSEREAVSKNGLVQWVSDDDLQPRSARAERAEGALALQ